MVKASESPPAHKKEPAGMKSMMVKSLQELTECELGDGVCRPCAACLTVNLESIV